MSVLEAVNQMSKDLQSRIDDAYLRMASAKTPKARRQALKEMEALLAERAADPEEVARLERERGLSATTPHQQHPLT